MSTPITSTPKLRAKEPVGEDDGFVNIEVKCQDSTSVKFKIKNDIPLGRLMISYSKRANQQLELLKFYYDGHRVKPSHTPIDLHMGVNDYIEVFPEQIGGH